MATQIHGNLGKLLSATGFWDTIFSDKAGLACCQAPQRYFMRANRYRQSTDRRKVLRGEKNLEWIGDKFLTSPRSVVHRLHQKLTEDHVECRVMLTCVRWKYLIQENPTGWTHQTRMEKFSSARLYMILASFSDQWNGIWRTSCSVDLHDLATSLLPVITVILLFSSTVSVSWTITTSVPSCCGPLWSGKLWRICSRSLQRFWAMTLPPFGFPWRTDASVECRNGNSSLSVWLIWGKSNCVSWLVCKMHLMKW